MSWLKKKKEKEVPAWKLALEGKSAAEKSQPPEEEEEKEEDATHEEEEDKEEDTAHEDKEKGEEGGDEEYSDEEDFDESKYNFDAQSSEDEDATRKRKRDMEEDIEKGRTTVKVENLAFETASGKLRKIFSECGDILAIDFSANGRAAYIKYETKEAAARALVKNRVQVDNRSLRVDLLAPGAILPRASQQDLDRDLVNEFRDPSKIFAAPGNPNKVRGPVVSSAVRMFGESSGGQGSGFANGGSYGMGGF